MNCEELGLRCGIECHQQLDTKKLFCNCPSTIRDDKPDIAIKRKLRTAAGETGEVDEAALHEFEKKKYFVYNAYYDTTCLVELDEDPPHPLNKEALSIALQVALMLKADIIDTIQVMRKTVVDGSNTAGFQRTALIAMNGRIDTSYGRVTVPIICLEEEAAKIIERTPDYDVYNLSRLGIPLIEIGTGPDIRTPEQAREVAEKLGMMLRSTGKVKRGLGTIRQDVNVSIRNGARVEIKGAQDLKLLPKLVEYECIRQYNLIKIKEELKKIKLKENLVDITNVLKNSSSKIIKNVLEKKGIVVAAKLEGFAGFVGKEIQPNRRLGTELSDYAKVKAGVGGLFHSDELPAYDITEEEVKKIKTELRCKEKDAFILIADNKEKAERGIQAALQRAVQATIGVPEEVRRANKDGTTSYLRPMPGASRMYPETDIPLIKPSIEGIEVPELIIEKAKKIEEMGVNKELVIELLKSHKKHLFEQFVHEFKEIEPSFIAHTLINIPKEIKTRLKLDPGKITENDYEVILNYLNHGVITKEAVFEILTDVANNKKINVDKYKKLTDAELEKSIKKIVAENKNVPLQGLIGIAMQELRGRAEGKKIVEMIKKEVE